MSAHTAKLSRAESARINGAKSSGPKTSAGLLRSQTANCKDGLYAVRDYKLPRESNEEFAEFQVRIHAYWQPNGVLAGQLVEELAGNIWEANRVHAAKSGYLHDLLAVIARNSPPCASQAKLNLEAEKQASVAGGTMDRSNARLGRLARQRDRIERQLLRLEKRSCTSGWSQKSLKTNNRQNPEIPVFDDAKPGDTALSESPVVVEVGIIIANANLKAAEGAANPTLVRQWEISASMTARRLITAFTPADPDGAAAWQVDVDYGKQVETYCDYTIYALALQAGDLTQRVELADLLKRHSPASPYIALLRQQPFIAFRQAGHHARALALAEEDILLHAASKAYERQEKSKVTIYARRLLDTLPAKPAPRSPPAVTKKESPPRLCIIWAWRTTASATRETTRTV